MASYRFCRTDDVPLLVEAHEACYRVHFPDLAPLDADGFKRRTRALDLWTSSCMIAFAGRRHPIAVLLAAKREKENLIWRFGVHPEHQRQGHGRHLLASLGAKMAILGPPQLRVELPAGNTAARRFLEACGYRVEATCVDFRAAPLAAAPAGAELAHPASVTELLEAEALDLAARRAWSRAPESVLRRKDELRGLAVGGTERVDAHLLYHDRESGDGTTREIVCWGAAVEQARAELLLRLLFDACRASSPGPLVVPRVAPDEIDHALLAAWGFAPGPQTLRMIAEARPG